MTITTLHTSNDQATIITTLPKEDHHALVIMAAQLDIPRNKLYSLLLQYCLYHAPSSIAEMLAIVTKNTKP